MIKKIALFVGLIISLTLVGYAQKAKIKADPANDVRAAFDQMIDGIRESDAEKTSNAYENSDRVLLFNYNGTATIGWENMRSNRESIYAKTKNVSLEITGLRVEMLSPRSAYVSCKWKQTQDNEGITETSTGRMTLVYKLIGKDWKIVHSHTSPDKLADVEIIEQAPAAKTDDRERVIIQEKKPSQF
jgi:ketosteroid isomerase-like protein